MKIALVSQEFPPETAHGGIGSQNHAKAHGLAAMGHEVHVLSHSVDLKRHEYQDGNVRITRIPGPDYLLAVRSEAVRWLAYSTLVAAAIEDLHARHSFDLLEFPEWGSEAFVHLLNRDEQNDPPTVIHLHGPVVMFAHAMGWPDPGSEFFRLASMMESTCLRLADAVFSSSRCSATWCAEYYDPDLAKIPVIHTGVNSTIFRPRDVPKGTNPTIVFVGQIERNKGVGDLVEASCRLAHEFPDLRLLLVGCGNEDLIGQLRERAIANGTPTLLDFRGFVPRTQLPELLSSAHVFAAPSVYEGGPGFVYLEAMSCGLPVIACSGSGACEIVTPEQTGLLVSPHDTTVLTTAIRRLLTNVELRESMGRRAREYVLVEADSRLCLQRLVEFYEAVIARCE